MSNRWRCDRIQSSPWYHTHKLQYLHWCIWHAVSVCRFPESSIFKLQIFAHSPAVTRRNPAIKRTSKGVRVELDSCILNWLCTTLPLKQIRSLIAGIYDGFGCRTLCDLPSWNVWKKFMGLLITLSRRLTREGASAAARDNFIFPHRPELTVRVYYINWYTWSVAYVLGARQ